MTINSPVVLLICLVACGSSATAVDATTNTEDAALAVDAPIDAAVDALAVCTGEIMEGFDDAQLQTAAGFEWNLIGSETEIFVTDGVLRICNDNARMNVRMLGPDASRPTRLRYRFRPTGEYFNDHRGFVQLDHRDGDQRFPITTISWRAGTVELWAGDAVAHDLATTGFDDWVTVEIAPDWSASTLDVFVDDQQVGAGIPWRDGRAERLDEIRFGNIGSGPPHCSELDFLELSCDFTLE